MQTYVKAESSNFQNVRQHIFKALHLLGLSLIDVVKV